MTPIEQFLQERGYIRLPPGSYFTWVSERWHRMFVRRGLIRQNFFGQYSPLRDSLPEFIKWMDLYAKTMHDKDFPKSEPQLTESEKAEIRLFVT